MTKIEELYLSCRHLLKQQNLSVSDEDIYSLFYQRARMWKQIIKNLGELPLLKKSSPAYPIN